MIDKYCMYIYIYINICIYVSIHTHTRTVFFIVLALQFGPCCQSIGAPQLADRTQPVPTGPGCYHGCIAMAHERVYIATEDKPVLIGSKDDPVPEGIKVAWQIVDLNHLPGYPRPVKSRSKTKDNVAVGLFWALEPRWYRFYFGIWREVPAKQRQLKHNPVPEAGTLWCQ